MSVFELHGYFPKQLARLFEQTYHVSEELPRNDSQFSFALFGAVFLANLSLLGFISIFPVIAVLSAHVSEGTKTLRSLGQERKTQTSSLISTEKG